MDQNVLLLNFGGPKSADEVQPFLRELFSDTVGIRFGVPAWFQRLLARFFSYRRAPSIIEKYKEIGGGSPLVPLTDTLVARLQDLFKDIRFYSAMRYTEPRAISVLEKMKSDGVSEAMVLPLYPHYSIATVESSMADVQQACNNLGYFPKLKPLCAWYTDETYLTAICTQIQKGLSQYFSQEQPLLLFSAHGVPVSYIKEGDPYAKQISDCMNLILEKLSWTGESRLGWQSRVGPVEWLSPNMDDLIPQLGREGHTSLLVIPISFVSDHIETLHEIDIEYAHLAASSGIKRFHRMPSLNVEEEFINCLATLITKHYNISRCVLPTCRCGYLPDSNVKGTS